MNGVGDVTLARLRSMAARGGWMDSADWLALCGQGNRTPFLIFGAQVLDSFNYCDLSDRQQHIGYRLTERGHELLEVGD